MPLVTQRRASTIARGGFLALLIAGCSSPSAAQPPATRGIAAPSASVATPALSVASPRPSPGPRSSASPSPSTQSSPIPSQVTASPAAAEQPVAPETNPAGDIPDTQVFVAYASNGGGYQLKVPEGWARSEAGSTVRFVNKLDGVEVTVNTANSAPAPDAASQVAELQRTGRAVQIRSIQQVQLPSGSAVIVDYTSNSGADSVTNKQVRLENNAYLLYANGKLATLSLWAPLGADNADQWQQIAQSFRWL